MAMELVAAGGVQPKAVALPKLEDVKDLKGLRAVAAAVAAGASAGLAVHMQALEPGEHQIFWRRILEVAEVHLSSERIALGPNGEPVDQESADVVLAVAALLSAFAEGALDVSRDATLPPAFAETASLCQGILLTIPDVQAQALVAGALELICADAFDGREDFYGGCLMYIIGRCLEPKATGADVARLHKVRGLLLDMDWEHESIESLKMQLMNCAASPNFMRTNHGPELLAFFFTAHASFTAEVHSTVKNQVMYVRPPTLKAYSVALFKAWKVSEGSVRVQIEHCVQDWVLLAIRTARKSADRARVMLEELHRHHHEDQVNDLLCRIYGPLLWRSLKVANSQVRENAARLLQYAFPLIPNELGRADKEQEWTKQVRLLRETLEDPSEPVRRVGISAVCVVLKNYWGIMPPAEIAEVLNVLINRCARDKKAPLVRAAVAEGFSWVLEEPLTHPTMGAVLQQMADLLNDKSPVVRAAFINLLNAVNRCRGMGMSVTTVVDTQELLLRLASEHTEGQAERLQKGLQGFKRAAAAADSRASPEVVARHLARLIGPSLFLQDLAQQVQRCRQLMQVYPLGLLALLSHLQDVAAPSERVKLAAALFHYGIKEVDGAAAANAGGPRPKMAATMLRVVGVLLEGVATELPAKRKKKGPAAVGGRIPKELEGFVYEHIREEDFLHLLKASHEDSGAAARLREDLLFALSPLDPERLPRTAELIGHELSLACRGGSAPSRPRLAALVRSAARWGLLEASLEPAWERLAAAADRLRLRQPAGGETVQTVAVVELALRDQDVRSIILPAKATVLKQIVEGMASAFCSAWSAGAAELLAGPRAETLLLGPAAEVWPRMLGLIARAAVHVEYRAVPPAAAKPPAQDGAAPEDAPMEQAPAVRSPFLGLAEAALEQVALALTSGPSGEALAALEAAAKGRGSTGGEPPMRKRAKSSGSERVVPADVDAALRVHERLLEALNAAHFLSVLAPGAAKDGAAPAAGGTSHALAPAVEDRLWRWAAVADALRPLPEGTRLARVWTFLGRRVQQLAQTEVPTPDVVEAARRLLFRAGDGLPADEAELRGALQALFRRLEFEPQLVQLVASILGREEGAAAAGEASEPRPEAHERVRAAITELLPGFRNLRAVFLSDQERSGEARLRVLASPTPLKAAELGRSRRSFSAVSRSPPPQSVDGSEGESLFDRCFARGGAKRSRATASVASADAMSEVSGEDAD